MGLEVVTHAPFNLNNLNQQTKALWPAIYHNRQTQLGNTATLVNFGDEKNAGLVSASTFTGKKYHASGLSPIWTPNQALSGFDTPFNLAVPGNWIGSIPFLTLNGNDEEMDTPDNAYWSDVGAFSVGMWIYLNTAASNALWAKWDETSASELREFLFSLDSNGDLGFTIYDESANAAVGRKYDTAIATGAWHQAIGTFSGGTDAADISIILDGTLVDDADIVDDGGFANAEDLATIVSIGYLEGTGGAKEQLFDGLIAGGPCCPWMVLAEITEAQANNMFQLERLAMGV